MSNDSTAIDKKVNELAEQLNALKNQVDELVGQVNAITVAQSPIATIPREKAHTSTSADHTPEEEDNHVRLQEIDNRWAGAALLSNLAILCFLLVIALILRTLVLQFKLLDHQVGAWIGVFYATLLMAWDHVRNARGYHRAPVYAACGTALLLVIISENILASTPFIGGLSTCLILGMNVVVMSALSIRYNVALPINLAVIGVSIVGLWYAVTHDCYLEMVPVLVLANMAAYVTSRAPYCRWLIWAVLLMTSLFWALWAHKLHGLFSAETPLETSALDLQKKRLAFYWFMLTLVGVSISYLGLVIWATFHKHREFGIFEHLLTITNISWTYALAWYVTNAWQGGERWLSIGGLCGAASFLALAYWFLRHGEDGARISTTFTLVSAILLAVSLRDALGVDHAPVALWGLGAFGLAVLAVRWNNHKVSAISVLLQIYSCIVAIVTGLLHATVILSQGRLALMIGMAVLVLVHNFWYRNRCTETANNPISWTGVLLLLVAMIYVFGAVRMALFSALQTSQGNMESAFICGQSIAVNVGALGLLWYGVSTRDTQILVAAIIAAVLGGVKVFAFDLSMAHGLSLVLAVFSFGLTALVGSLVWRRWQRESDEEGGPPLVKVSH